MIERINEDCLYKILDTMKICLMSILYLETGQLPAKFHIQFIKLNFLKYILHPNIRTSNIYLDLTFDNIFATKTKIFRRIVKQKVRNYAFTYLVSKIISIDKETYYKSDFKCQAYLKPNNILTLQEKRTFFSFLAIMNNLSHYFQGNNKI